MDKKTFSVEEALNTGWKGMKENFWLFLGCLIIAFVVTGIPRTIARTLGDNSGGLSGLFFLLASLIDMIFAIGFIKIALKILDGEKPEFNDLFCFPKYFIDYLGASILTGLLVIAGCIMLIVPGIYWAIKFQFFGYCVIDRKLDPIPAMRQSARITKIVKWKLFWFGILCALINILGFLCLFVGVFVTIPTTLVAFAFVYRKLMSQTESVETVTTKSAVPKKVTKKTTKTKK